MSSERRGVPSGEARNSFDFGEFVMCQPQGLKPVAVMPRFAPDEHLTGRVEGPLHRRASRAPRQSHDDDRRPGECRVDDGVDVILRGLAPSSAQPNACHDD